MSDDDGERPTLMMLKLATFYKLQAKVVSSSSQNLSLNVAQGPILPIQLLVITGNGPMVDDAVLLCALDH